MTPPTAADVLSALRDAAALLDEAGRIEAAHPALARFAPAGDVAPILGLDFFDFLRDLSGIGAARDAFARALPLAELHDSFAVSRVDPRVDLTERYRLELRTFRSGTDGGDGPDGGSGAVHVLALLHTVGGDDHLEAQAHALEQRLGHVRDLKHQLSNTAMGLVGHVELLSQDVDADHPLHGRVERVREHARRVRDLIQALGDALTGRRRPPSAAPDGSDPDALPPDDSRRA